jgi:hypothetical protein
MQRSTDLNDCLARLPPRPQSATLLIRPTSHRQTPELTTKSTSLRSVAESTHTPFSTLIGQHWKVARDETGPRSCQMMEIVCVPVFLIALQPLRD